MCENCLISTAKVVQGHNRKRGKDNELSSYSTQDKTGWNKRSVLIPVDFELIVDKVVRDLNTNDNSMPSSSMS